MIDKFKLSKYFLIFLLILIIFISTISYFLFGNKNDDGLIQNSSNIIYITLGKEFKLQKDQIAILEDNLLQIKILEFINDPCPEGARCIWSGQGIMFEFTNVNGEKITNMTSTNLIQAFGFKVEIIDSDYTNYVLLKVEEIVDKNVS